jgi:hypothetical protein
MIKKLTVEHVSFSTTRSFEDVVKSFEENVGTLEDIGWSSIPAASRGLEDFEARVRDRLDRAGSRAFSRSTTATG